MMLASPHPPQRRRQTTALSYSASTRELVAARERKRTMNNFVRETSCEAIYIFLLVLLVLFNQGRKCSQISMYTIVITLFIKGLVFVGLKCVCCGFVFFKLLKIQWVRIMYIVITMLYMVWQFWIIIDFFANNN